jgi:hypothetical protein
MVKFTASIQEISKTDPVMDFTMCLLNSVTTGHILHLSSRSYSQHMALDVFYNGIGELVDGFIEAFQGKYGLLTKYPATADLFAEQDPITYLTYLSDEVSMLRKANGFPQDSELQNEVDNIANLINSTLYKLKFLA